MLKRLGLRVSKISSGEASMQNWATCLELLKARGFQPRTIFDIGVAMGTPELYAAFPDASYYLIDPTRESLQYMEAIAQQLNATILNVALGDNEGSFTIEVRPDDIAASSFFEEVGPLGETSRYEVPVRRFDRIVGAFERPALCKIDVQGAEIAVLRGMGDRIGELDALIIETSTIATMKQAPETDEVITFLSGQGFVIYDVLALSRRPLDSALAQVDVLFVKRDSELRSDRRWRTDAR